jgi:hypothetical protein
VTQVDDGLGGFDSAMREILEHPAVILQFLHARQRRPQQAEPAGMARACRLLPKELTRSGVHHCRYG